MAEEQKNIEMLRIAFDAIRYGTSLLSPVHMTNQGYTWSIPKEFIKEIKTDEMTDGKADQNNRSSKENV